ncbi:MAG TPA: delta-60 repeat domain-containing protein, partial [Chitinophagales bacterium]|nr:delta-60 repeat domain-containing protein [Chitinophagales bacterium]
LSTGAFEHAYGSELAVQPDGKIVQAGDVGATGAFRKIAVIRYSPNGTLDNAFGVAGKTTAPLGTYHAYAAGMALQPDGKIVVGGHSQALFNASHFGVLRLNADGSPDNTFGVGGSATISFGSGGPEYEYSETYDMVLQPDGKIVVVGRSYLESNAPAGTALAMARFNSDGTLDAGFGSGGKVFRAEAPYAYRLNGVALQPDGKLLVTGYRVSSGAENFLTGRFLPDGTPDSSFGGNGLVVTALSATNYNHGRDVTILSDGKIVSVGNASPDT